MRHSHQSYRAGFSTIEILIAMTILVSTIAGVVLVSLGNQSLLAQGSLNEGAVHEAQRLIEVERAQAQKDFRLVHTMSTSSDGTYDRAVFVSSVAGEPYLMKRVTAQVSWHDMFNRTRSVSIAHVLSDFTDASTTDTCDSSLSGDWTHPHIDNYSLSRGNMLPTTPPSGHTFSTSGTISTVDAYHQRLYVALSKKSVAGDDSLFVFDSANPLVSPVYRGSINNNPSVTEGLNAIAVSGNYLYGANGHVSNFKTCKPSANCSQLQIFNISNPAAIPVPISFLIPTSTPAFVTGTSTDQALGSSIYYRDGYVYLGLSKTATGPEFNIIDVHDPSHPSWVGGYHVGYSIDGIYVRNGYAYLAANDKTRELIILDIHDLSSPTLASFFDPVSPLHYEVGKSIYTRGDVLYAGMSFSPGTPTVYAFDIAHPSTLLLTGSSTIAGTVIGMMARDSLLFVLTSTMRQLHVLDISIPGTIAPYVPGLNIPGNGSSLDCEGNYFFASSNITGAAPSISIIGPSL